MMTKTLKHISKRQVKTWEAVLLWTVMAALIMAILVPCFSLIWRDRTETHTRDECILLADAVLKQSAVEQKRIQKNNQFLQTYLFALNAMSGWAYAYGGTDEKELSAIYAMSGYTPEGVAVLRDGKYQVLFGEFPREEFDAAREKRDRERTASDKSDSAFSGSTSFLTVEGDLFYLSALLPHAGTLVISKLASVPELLDDSHHDLDLKKMAGSFLNDSEVGMAMVRLSDHVVLQVNGKLDIKRGETLEELPDENGRLKIGDTWYVGGAADDAAYRIYAAVPVSDIFSKTVVSPTLLALIFTGMFLLTGLYAWFLRMDVLRGRVEQDSAPNAQEPIGTVLIRHVRMLFYVIAAGVVLLILLNSALYVVDGARVWGNKILSDVEQYFEKDGQNVEFLASYRKEHKLKAMNCIRSLIEMSPERATDHALSDLSGAIERDLFLLDESGVVLAGSRQEYDFSGITDPRSEQYELAGVLEGKADYKSVVISAEDASSRLCWAVRCRSIGGMLISVDSISQIISFSDYYADYKVPPGLLLLAVDLETGSILSGSDEAYYGKSIESLGLGEEVCQDGFASDVMLDGRRCFLQTSVHGKRADLIAADLGYLTRLYFPIILTTVAVGLLTVILMLLLAWRLQKSFWTDLPEAEEPGKEGPQSFQNELRPEAAQKEKPEEETLEEENAEFYREMDGRLRAERSAVGRWLDLNTPFRRQSADEKLRTVLHIASILLLIAGYVGYQRRSAHGLLGSTFAYLFQRSWRAGFNAYGIAYALLVFFIITLIGITLRKLILLFGKRLGNRGATIARLLSSFISYASVVFAFGYSLVFVGVNTTMILASAGIVGLGISIGAKDLISDILAGIAIVFEGEYRTGDIVEINGYRGTVEEIGVRTTKVMSMENVKVFRNSEISGVINMTQRYSIAQVQIDVSRAEPIEKVEEIFRKELPGIRRKLPEAVSDIELCGIDQLNANCAVLLFQTKCREADRIRVERMLRREFDLVMEREGICALGLLNAAPFPTVPGTPIK